MLHQRRSLTVNGITFRFRSDETKDRITVTILHSENRDQRRSWAFAMKAQGFTDVPNTMEACWTATLESLGLKATKVDERGATVSYSVSGLVESLETLVTLSHGLWRAVQAVEYREVSVPRGGRPQDYAIVSDKGQERETRYIPCPHGPRPKQPKPAQIVDTKPLDSRPVLAPDYEGHAK